jgi:tellurite resistance protein TerC
MELETAPWIWATFFALFLSLLALDLGVLNKKDHVVGVKESLRMSAFYALIAFLFAGWVWYIRDAESAGLFITGYLVEQSLSLDNIFVISLVLTYFKVPRPYQHRVLFWGIIGVILMRGVMIGLGTTIVTKFQPVLLFFAAFLVITGIKMLLMDDDDEHNISENKVVKFFEKRMRVTHELHGHDFLVKQPDPKQGGKLTWFATPLLLALMVVEVVDVIFAVDSIPAILAITQDTFLVYTSNLFAIMGLRSLYFALSAMLDRFKYLKFSLALVLVFIGAKVLLHKGPELLAKYIPGEELAASIAKMSFHIPTALSLAITIGLLIGGALFSLVKTKDEKNGDKPAAAE